MSEGKNICPACGTENPVHITLCQRCHRELTVTYGPTAPAPPIEGVPIVRPQRKAPDPAAFPPYMVVINVAGILLLILISLSLILTADTPSPVDLQRKWLTEFGEGMKTGKLRTRQIPWHPIRIQRSYLRPDERSIEVFEADSNLCQAANLVDAKPEEITQFTTPAQFWTQFPQLRKENPTSDWLAVTLSSSVFSIEVGLRYWPNGKDKLEADVTRSQTFLRWYRWQVFSILVLAGIVFLSRAILISRYRRNALHDWERYKAGYDNEMGVVLQLLDRAEKIAMTGDIPQALHAVNQVLEVNPGMSEALHMRRRLAAWQVTGVSEPKAASPEPGVKIEMYLKLMGSPYAWLAPNGRHTITVGRQRPKRQSPELDTGESTGCDVVIRIPGDEDTTSRISRRHLSLQQFGGQWHVTDMSKHGTKLDGRQLARDVPARIQAGSRLTLADVVTLEIQFRRQLTGRKVDGLIEVSMPPPPSNPGLDRPGHALQLEASIGNWVTEMDKDRTS